MNTSARPAGPRSILIFSLVYYPRFVGGAEVAVKEITNRLAAYDTLSSQDGFEFDMVTLNGGGEAVSERVGSVNVHRVFNKVGPLQKLFFPFAALFKAIALHRRRKYDATWSIMANYAGFAALFFKMKNPNIPFILTLQEGDPFSHIRKRVGIFYPLFKKIFRRADKIQAISNYLADWAKDMGATCPVTVVPNAVDYGRFSKEMDPAKRDALRVKLGFSDTDIVLVTAGRLVKKNGVKDIVSSLQYLSPACKFLSIGDGEDLAALQEQVKELKLDGRVVFNGFIAHSELPDYLKASDIFVRPSLSEGLGNSFLEAMAAGIPVIATPVGGIPDFLVDGETGLLCEVGNPKSIAQKAEKLIKDGESRDYIVGRAKAMVKEKYQWDKVAAEMRRLFV